MGRYFSAVGVILLGILVLGVASSGRATSAQAASALDDYCQECAEPFDLVQLNNGATLRVLPLADYPGRGPAFEGMTRRFDKSDVSIDLARYTIRSIEFFESFVLGKIAGLLEPKSDALKAVAVRERLQTANKLLDALLRFHLGTRRHAPLGENPWRALQFAIEEKTARARALLAEDLIQDIKSSKDLLGVLDQLDAGGLHTRAQMLVLTFIQEHLEAEDFATARTLLSRVDEDRFAEKKAEKFHDVLRYRAAKLFQDGKEAAGARGIGLIEEALAYYPWLPGAHDELARRTGAYKILYVAVPELPEFLSPATAWTDTEKQAVELLFESLFEPRTVGVRGHTYQPVLARAEPADGLSRKIALVRDAFWDEQERLTTADVRHTAQLLGSPDLAGHASVWRELLLPPRQEGNAFEMTLTARQGLFDPFGPLTFKILPHLHRGRPIAHADDPEFAKAPTGSGPFVLVGRKKEDGREYLVFRSNHVFARKSRSWTSGIREVRMLAWTDPAKEPGQPAPHLVLGMPTEKIAKLRQLGYKDIRDLLADRVYILAVNHRRPALANLDLRRAVAHGLDREAILDEAYRGGKGRAGEKYHHPANGPFPARCWAACPPPRVPADLYRPEAKLDAKKAASEVGAVRLTLKYPTSAPGVRKACEAMVGQWTKMFADAGAKIEIELAPVTPRELREALISRDYDLAYHHVDFSDETYWLWPLFDPHPDAVGPGGSNYLGYVNDAKLQNLLRSAMATRQFTTLRELNHAIHAHFVERMPFIPLWQLHDHIAVHSSLNPVGLDPLLVFPNVLHWKWNP